ncbi:hypothetical protein [Novosphingobium sp.]|uniref:hypothetical protein n=1 Tax=Novosphingobium sp. TaxID=1874826 RepID=UPI002FDF5F15
MAGGRDRHGIRPRGRRRLRERRRGNWTWQDGIDAPLVEQAETYLLAYGPPESPLATWTLQSPRMDLPPDLLARLSALAPGAAFSVRQQVTYAVSAPLNLFPNPSFRKESSR